MPLVSVGRFAVCKLLAQRATACSSYPEKYRCPHVKSEETDTERFSDVQGVTQLRMAQIVPWDPRDPPAAK